MRFLALARSDDAWFATRPAHELDDSMLAEARRAWELRTDGIIRDISWRTDRRDVVIELEAPNERAARTALDTLPLVVAGAVSFEVIGLAPYDGWRRLFADAEALVVERAVAWALERLGSGSYALRCLSFVEDAYERPNAIEIFGGSTARESADRYGASGDPSAATRGSFVFFATTGLVDGQRRDWGHVGLGLGDGRMVHAWPEVRLDPIETVASLPAGDWSSPAYLGWASPSVILAGAAPARGRR